MSSKNLESLKDYNREYYQRDRKHLLEKQREKNRRLAVGRRKWLVEYKKTLRCLRCGEIIQPRLLFTIRKVRTRVLKLVMP